MFYAKPRMSFLDQLQILCDIQVVIVQLAWIRSNSSLGLWSLFVPVGAERNSRRRLAYYPLEHAKTTGHQ